MERRFSKSPAIWNGDFQIAKTWNGDFQIASNMERRFPNRQNMERRFPNRQNMERRFPNRQRINLFHYLLDYLRLMLIFVAIKDRHSNLVLKKQKLKTNYIKIQIK